MKEDANYMMLAVQKFLSRINEYLEYDLFDIHLCMNRTVDIDNIGGYLRLKIIVNGVEFHIIHLCSECWMYDNNSISYARMRFSSDDSTTLFTTTGVLTDLKEELRLEKRAKSLPGVLSI